MDKLYIDIEKKLLELEIQSLSEATQIRKEIHVNTTLQDYNEQKLRRIQTELDTVHRVRTRILQLFN